jgi:hypothetical protein
MMWRTGKAGYSTPSGTFTPTSMNEIWYSKEWDNAPMPHAVFFMKDGYAIHGSHEVKHLGKPASHGCVRISPQNAATLYALVAKSGLKNTQVVLAGDAPGVEAKLASKSRSGTRYSQNTRVRSSPGSTTMQSLSHSHKGAAGFSDGCSAARRHFSLRNTHMSMKCLASS